MAVRKVKRRRARGRLALTPRNEKPKPGKDLPHFTFSQFVRILARFVPQNTLNNILYVTIESQINYITNCIVRVRDQAIHQRVPHWDLAPHMAPCGFFLSFSETTKYESQKPKSSNKMKPNLCVRACYNRARLLCCAIHFTDEKLQSE